MATPSPNPAPTLASKQPLTAPPKDIRGQPVSGAFNEPDEDGEDRGFREPGAAIANPAKARGVSLGLRERYAGIVAKRFATACLLFQRNDSSQAPLGRKGEMPPSAGSPRSASGSMETVLPQQV